jgi:hypothetical protein
MSSSSKKRDYHGIGAKLWGNHILLLSKEINITFNLA